MIIETVAPTLIAEGSRLEGRLTFYSGTGIYGVVDGQIIQQSRETLQIARTAWIHGDLESEGPILVEGRVEGNVTSLEKIILGPTAHVNGRLTAPKIVIQAGAVFEGEACNTTVQTKVELKAAA